MTLTRAGLATAALVLVADQLTKLWILHGLELRLGQSLNVLPVFSLTLVHNYGISLGLLQASSEAARWLLIGLTVGIAVWLVRWLCRVGTPLMATALGLIIGGAIGNIVDRIRFGYVVDFLHAHAFGWSFYIFNVADAAITVGVVLWLLDSLTGSGDKGASSGSNEAVV